MEKNEKEHDTRSQSNFVMKVFLLVLCVVVTAQFALLVRCFASLNALNNKFNALKEEKTLGFKYSRNERKEYGTKRSKRATEDTDIKKALMKLEKLEGR